MEEHRSFNPTTLQYLETKVNFYIVCSKECCVVLDLTKVVKFYLKRSMLHVFGSWNH